MLSIPTWATLNYWFRFPEMQKCFWKCFQGSEQKTIVYVLENGAYQNWKHVYTAVTRGEERVYIIAKNSDLRKAIPGQVINRSTRLAGLISEMVSVLQAEREDLFPRPSQALSETPKQSSTWADFKDSPGQTQYSTNDVSGGCNFFMTGSLCMGKRQRSNVSDITPNKKQKVRAIGILSTTG